MPATSPGTRAKGAASGGAAAGGAGGGGASAMFEFETRVLDQLKGFLVLFKHFNCLTEVRDAFVSLREQCERLRELMFGSIETSS